MRHYLSELAEKLKNIEGKIVITRHGMGAAKLLPEPEQRNMVFPNFREIRTKLCT